MTVLASHFGHIYHDTGDVVRLLVSFPEPFGFCTDTQHHLGSLAAYHAPNPTREISNVPIFNQRWTVAPSCSRTGSQRHLLVSQRRYCEAHSPSVKPFARTCPGKAKEYIRHAFVNTTPDTVMILVEIDNGCDLYARVQSLTTDNTVLAAFNANGNSQKSGTIDVAPGGTIRFTYEGNPKSERSSSGLPCPEQKLNFLGPS